MNTMNMPGFTADKSVYKPRGNYRLSAVKADITASQPGHVQLMQQQMPIPDGGFPPRCSWCFTDPNSRTGCSQLCIDRFPFKIFLSDCVGCNGFACGGTEPTVLSPCQSGGMSLLRIRGSLIHEQPLRGLFNSPTLIRVPA